MKLKKLLSICLAALLCVSLLPSAAFAQAQAEAEQARVLAIVRERIGDTSRYEHFDSSSRTASSGVITYRFEWSTEKDGNYASLSVSCTSGGVITDYYAHDSSVERSSDKPNIHKMTSAQAMEKAKVLMDTLNPQLSAVLVLSARSEVESLYDTGYSFTVTRVENGIPFYGQTGSIRVNAAADAVESFYVSYDESLPVPAADGLIDRAAAEKAYGEKLGMELVYRAYYKDRERIIYPVYVPAQDWYMHIDAKTGEAVDMRSLYSDSDKLLAGGAGSDSSSKNESMSDITFSEAELAELEKVEGLLDSDAVLAEILKNPLLDIPAGVELVSTGRSKDIYSDTYTYSFRLENNTEDNYASVRITADAKTGRLKSFYSYRDYAADAKVKNTVEAAKAAAKTLAGDVFGEYKLYEDYESEYGVYYHRYVNGVPFTADSLSVTVHPDSGKVTNFNVTYTDAQFPSVENAITPAQAAEYLFAQMDYVPHYMAHFDVKGNAETKIVYVLDDAKPQYVDAFTGVLLNGYSNEPYKENVWKAYTDVAGHYAQTQIDTLARFGIRFEGENFTPDAVITQAEFVSLLVSAFYNGSGTVGADMEYAYRQAQNYSILTAEERNDGAAVTRGLAAKYLIRALGFEEVASLEGIYVCPFGDVTDNIGHISILNAMGVVRGDGAGNFNPNGALTRADAVILIYNYLSR